VGLEEQVIGWLAEQNMAVYLVGGCVRDLLLGHPIYDLDVVTDGDGLALARHVANHFGGAYYPLDEVRSTGRAILRSGDEQRLVVDVARLRGPDLAADLAGRDFTINAMAADVRAPGEVIDEHGGRPDVQARLIRPVSEASIRDDPLRALRAIRLAAQLGFALAPETERLICQDGAALSQVAGERTRDEVARLLARHEAACYLRQMDDLGLLTVVFPELEPLRGLAQPPPHYLDVLSHSLETVQALEMILEQVQVASSGQQEISDIDHLAPFTGRVQAHLAQIMSDGRPRLVTLKLAALLHDTGKAAARTTDERGKIRSIGHDKESVKLAGQVLRRLRFHNAEVRTGETVVRHHMRPLLLADQDRVSSRAVYRFFRDTGDAGIDVLLHALADDRATFGPGTEDRAWPRLVALAARMLADYWERGGERVAPPPLIDGNDLLSQFQLQPGPEIGELLEAVREAQVSGEVSTREEALSLVRKKIE
jgi:tRNA nucleotidyltransferase/poly(A) polymerase